MLPGFELLTGPRAMDAYLSLNGMRALTTLQWERIKALRNAEYFLVLNGVGTNVDDRARCGRCGAKHRVLTRECIYQPYRGLRGALHAYCVVRSSRGDQRASLFGKMLPDLEDAHPHTARAGLLPDAAGNVLAEDILALEVGGVEAISAWDAERLVERLKYRGVPQPYIFGGYE
jgi:hypothetical protein